MQVTMKRKGGKKLQQQINEKFRIENCYTEKYNTMNGFQHYCSKKKSKIKQTKIHILNFQPIPDTVSDTSSYLSCIMTTGNV